MTRTPLAILVVLSVFAATAQSTPVAAAPSETAAFAPFVAEMEDRLGNDFSGVLTKDMKKQQKALLKAKKLLDKASTSTATDLKTAGKVVKLIRKAFADEFAGPSKTTSFAVLLGGLLDDLEAIVDADLSALEALLGTLSDKGSSKVRKLLDKAAAALAGASAADLAAWAKSMGKAYKSYVKGDKIADKDKGSGGGGGKDGFELTINGKKQKPDRTDFVYSGTSGVLVIAASKLSLGGYLVTVAPNIGIFAPGSFGLSSASLNVTNIPPKTYATFSGTLTITSLDTSAMTVSGSFSFTAPGTGLTTGSVKVSGTFTNVKYVTGG